MVVRKPRWPARFFLLAWFCVLVVSTRPLFVGDTYWYVLDIKNSLGHGWTDDAGLWDFPHVLWRPLARVLAEIFLPFILGHFHQNVAMSINFLLVGLNILAALVCGFCVQEFIGKLTASPWAATWAAAAFLAVSSVLDYSRSGSAYLLGLAFLLLAFYLAVFNSSHSWKTAVLSGFAMGLSILLWIPYLVSLPAVILAGPLLDPDGHIRPKRHLYFYLLICLSAGVLVAEFYGLTLICAHLHTVSALLQWIRDTSHDPGRDRKLLRVTTGFPRSVYELGDMARWIKWFLFRDPYANVGFLELLQVSFLKLAVFYATLVALGLALWRSPTGKRLLLVIAIAAIPHIGMALTYESGSPERYLPFLPMVFMGFGYVLASRNLRAGARVFLALLCGAHIPVNLRLLSTRTVNRTFAIAARSFGELTPMPAGNRLYVLNGSDERAQLLIAAPFDPIFQNSLPEFNPIVPFLGSRVPHWQSDFASQVLHTWDHSGEIWVTTRVLSERPQRNWAWVEGDDRRITWKAIHQFFKGFDHSETKGGDDGFFLVRDTTENRKMFLAIVGKENPN